MKLYSFIYNYCTYLSDKRSICRKREVSVKFIAFAIFMILLGPVLLLPQSKRSFMWKSQMICSYIMVSL